MDFPPPNTNQLRNRSPVPKKPRKVDHISVSELSVNGRPTKSFRRIERHRATIALEQCARSSYEKTNGFQIASAGAIKGHKTRDINVKCLNIDNLTKVYTNALAEQQRLDQVIQQLVQQTSSPTWPKLSAEHFLLYKTRIEHEIAIARVNEVAKMRNFNIAKLQRSYASKKP